MRLCTMDFSTSSRFWTVCSSCETVHRCSRSKEGLKHQCRLCKGWFAAVEVPTISINAYFKKRTTMENGAEANGQETRQLNSVNSNEYQFNINDIAAKKCKTIDVGTVKVEGETEHMDSSYSFKDVNKVVFSNHVSHAFDKLKPNTKFVSSNKSGINFWNNTSISNRKSPLDNSFYYEDHSARIVDPTSLDVQDSDFYDFDKDRTELCIDENQVWAVYDDNDAMPRFYALVDKVISRHPFKVQIRWMESMDINERFLGWASTGFWRACGKFMVGRTTITGYLNVFSHQVQGADIIEGKMNVLPQRGSVWAIYKNWQPDWNESTPKDVIKRYEIVEILTDFTETLGGSLIPLVKVDGYRSVYRKVKAGSQAIRWVPKTELFRFSHQIPFTRLLGNEAENAPVGCWELDTAAVPDMKD